MHLDVILATGLLLLLLFLSLLLFLFLADRRWIVVRDSTQVQARPGVVLGDRAGVNPVADAGAVDAAADTGAGDAALVNAGVATADAVLARTTTRLSIVSVLRVLAGLSLLMRNPSRLSEHRGA